MSSMKVGADETKSAVESTALRECMTIPRRAVLKQLSGKDCRASIP